MNTQFIKHNPFRYWHLLSMLVVLVLLCCTNQQHNNIKIFYGGTILTVDKDFSEIEAIAIQDNKIIATGDLAVIKKEYGKQAEMIDLDGKTMLPGFVDAHAHVISMAPVSHLMEYVGVAKFTTTAEALDYLKELADQAEDGEWIGASNWDPSLQEGPEALTFKELDEVSTEHPVFVLNTSGHLAYANRKAFEIAGITEDVVNPEGAEYVRDEDGHLTGTMKNLISFMPIWQKNPEMANLNYGDAIVSVLHKFNKEGITTTSELALGAGTGSPTEAYLLFDASKRDDFSARIRAYPSYIIDEKWDEAGITMNQGDDLARIVGFKLVADGSNQGFTGLQRNSYCCGIHQNSYGQEYTSVDVLTDIARKRINEGWQLAMHGNGDQGIDNILEAMQTLKDEGIDLAPSRLRIEHCSILHDDQIEKMKDLNISASFLIGHVYYWGVFMRDHVFGDEKVLLLDRCASVENENIGFTLHSDYAVTEADPLEMIYIAVNRNTWKEPDFILAPDERISVESAIRAVTSEAAWQLMSEHEIGSLEVGKYADMVILDKDPRKVDPTTIKDIEVLETWMNGDMVYSKY